MPHRLSLSLSLSVLLSLSLSLALSLTPTDTVRVNPQRKLNPQLRMSRSGLLLINPRSSKHGTYKIVKAGLWHIRQSWPDSSLDFQVKDLQRSEDVPLPYRPRQPHHAGGVSNTGRDVSDTRELWKTRR